MNKEKRRVPKLRFPGFTEDWEQRKLGECVDISTGYPFDSQDFNENGEYLVITNSNIQENTPFVLNNIGNRIDLDDSLKKYILDIDDLLITMDGTVGRVAIVVDTKLVLAQRVCRIKSNEPYYIYQLLSKNNFIQSMNKISHGGTIKHISLSEISEYQAFYPKSQKERIKISSVLTNYDKLITLHQRKLKHLNFKKKALLQKLFPKNGERHPELRFPEFTDAWEQRKLGDIATITGGGTPSTNISEYWNGDIDWYSPVEIGENRYVSRSTRKITKLGLEKSSAKILPVGTVLFTSRAGIGNTAILQAEGCTNQGFQSITPNSKELDTYFLYTMTPKLKRYGEVTGAGSTFVEVSGKQMEQMNLMIPSLEEQKHVSQLFELMDDTITLHQRKLEHLQLQKKALLQQMFV